MELVVLTTLSGGFDELRAPGQTKQIPILTGSRVAMARDARRNVELIELNEIAGQGIHKRPSRRRRGGSSSGWFARPMGLIRKRRMEAGPLPSDDHGLESTWGNSSSVVWASSGELGAGKPE